MGNSYTLEELNMGIGHRAWWNVDFLEETMCLKAQGGPKPQMSEQAAYMCQKTPPWLNASLEVSGQKTLHAQAYIYPGHADEMCLVTPYSCMDAFDDIQAMV